MNAYSNLQNVSHILTLSGKVRTKKNAFGAEKQNKKSKGEQSDLCDLEQVTLKPQLRAGHFLTIWMQRWYLSLLWGDEQSWLPNFGVHSAELGKLACFFSLKRKNSFRKFTHLIKINAARKSLIPHSVKVLKTQEDHRVPGLFPPRTTLFTTSYSLNGSEKPTTLQKIQKV